MQYNYWLAKKEAGEDISLNMWPHLEQSDQYIL